MLGFVLSFLTAIFTSLGDVFSKKTLTKLDKYTLAFFTNLLTALILLPFLFYQGIPEVNRNFWIALIIGGVLNTLTTLLYLTALKESDLSLSVPMLTFTPLFLLITSPLILGEAPSLLGMVGVILIVIGAYTLNIDKKKQGYLAPFKALIKEKGPRLMLIIAVIWSISSNMDKMGVNNSSVLLWITSLSLFLPIAILPFLIINRKNKVFSDIKLGYKSILLLTILGIASSVFQMTAVKLTLVPYVISIKRTSVIMSVALGYFIFKEKNIGERILGASIMVAGVVLIALS